MRDVKSVIPKKTLLLFVLAALLLGYSSISGTRAALTYYSENYTTRITASDIGVTLNENGSALAWRDYRTKNADGSWNEADGTLLGNLISKGEEFRLGVAYPERLSVTNSGQIDEFVRVTILRYWIDADGKKMTELSPDLIDLHFINDFVWLRDSSSDTSERVVLYYHQALAAGATTPALCDQLMVCGSLAAKVTQTTSYENGYTVITTTYDYDGVQFQLEAIVDAVQSHNGEDAIRSAWGNRVSIRGNTLSLG